MTVWLLFGAGKTGASAGGLETGPVPLAVGAGVVAEAGTVRNSLVWRLSSVVWRWRTALSHPWGFPEYENELARSRPRSRSKTTIWTTSTKSVAGAPQCPFWRYSSPA